MRVHYGISIVLLVYSYKVISGCIQPFIKENLPGINGRSCAALKCVASFIKRVPNTRLAYAPPRQFFSISCSFWKECLCPPPSPRPPAFGLRPTSLKSWIRHWKQSLYHEITVVLPQDEQKWVLVCVSCLNCDLHENTLWQIVRDFSNFEKNEHL